MNYSDFSQIYTSVCFEDIEWKIKVNLILLGLPIHFFPPKQSSCVSNPRL